MMGLASFTPLGSRVGIGSGRQDQDKEGKIDDGHE